MGAFLTKATSAVQKMRETLEKEDEGFSWDHESCREAIELRSGQLEDLISDLKMRFIKISTVCDRKYSVLQKMQRVFNEAPRKPALAQKIFEESNRLDMLIDHEWVMEND